jgi:hypothetical protein
VLERVRQRLLDDAVGRKVDARRKLPRRSLDVKVDVEARLAYPLREHVERREGRARRERELTVLVPEYPQEPAHLDERLPAGRLD